MLAEAADVNGVYEESIDNLKYRKPANKEKGKVITERERQVAAVDYYANVRTNVRCLR
jgi:chitin synthase